MVPDHWSNDAMVLMDRCGLLHQFMGLYQAALALESLLSWEFGEEEKRVTLQLSGRRIVGFFCGWIYCCSGSLWIEHLITHITPIDE